MEQQIRFEEAMQKLSEIVEKLEGGEGSLDDPRSKDVKML